MLSRHGVRTKKPTAGRLVFTRASDACRVQVFLAPRSDQTKSHSLVLSRTMPFNKLECSKRGPAFSPQFPSPGRGMTGGGRYTADEASLCLQSADINYGKIAAHSKQKLGHPLTMGLIRDQDNTGTRGTQICALRAVDSIPILFALAIVLGLELFRVHTEAAYSYIANAFLHRSAR